MVDFKLKEEALIQQLSSTVLLDCVLQHLHYSVIREQLQEYLIALLGQNFVFQLPDGFLRVNKSPHYSEAHVKRDHALRLTLNRFDRVLKNFMRLLQSHFLVWIQVLDQNQEEISRGSQQAIVSVEQIHRGVGKHTRKVDKDVSSKLAVLVEHES